MFRFSKTILMATNSLKILRAGSVAIQRQDAEFGIGCEFGYPDCIASEHMLSVSRIGAGPRIGIPRTAPPERVLPNARVCRLIDRLRLLEIPVGECNREQLLSLGVCRRKRIAAHDDPLDFPKRGKRMLPRSTGVFLDSLVPKGQKIGNTNPSPSSPR